MTLHYDLHIHSCLSPCGDMDMTPNNIVNMALIQELDVIAVTDHNTARQLPSVFAVAEQTDLLVIPGIEVCTSEEVHVVCLFDSLDDCMAFGEYLYPLLPNIQNQEAIFGVQAIMDPMDEITDHLDKLLINAANLDIDRLLAVLPQYHGHAIPAHVDKNAYSIISNLGFIPPDYQFPCVEVKRPPFDYGIDALTITNSDAHYLEDIAPAVRSLETTEKSCAAVLSSLGFESTKPS